MQGAEVLETTTSMGLVSRGLQSAGERVETTSHPQPDCKEGHKGKEQALYWTIRGVCFEHV